MSIYLRFVANPPDVLSLIRKGIVYFTIVKKPRKKRFVPFNRRKGHCHHCGRPRGRKFKKCDMCRDKAKKYYWKSKISQEKE